MFGLCSARAVDTDDGRFDAVEDALLPAALLGRTGGAYRGRALFPLSDAFVSVAMVLREDALLAFDAALSTLDRIGSDLVAFVPLVVAF